MDAEGSRRRERKELEERSEQVKVEEETKKRGKTGFKKGEEEIRRSGEKAKGECKEGGSKVLQVFEGMKRGGKKRDRNVIWRRVEGENKEERRWLIEEIMRKSLRRKLGIRGVEERKGKGGRWVLIVELEELRDKEEVLRKGEEIEKLWRMGIDEDMSMEEKRRRWRMMEAARRERARVKRMELSNRELWVEGRRWLWNEEGMNWKEEEEARGEEGIVEEEG